MPSVGKEPLARRQPMSSTGYEQSAKALKGDTRAAKLVIDLGHKHIAPHQTLEELRGDRPLFTFTEEERLRFSRDKLLEGVVFSKESNEPPKEDDDDGKSVL